MEQQTDNNGLIAVEIPLSIQFLSEKVQFPKGQIQITDKSIVFSTGDILLTFKYESIISAGKSKLNLLLFLRNGNPEEEEAIDEEQDQEGRYQDRVAISELKQVLTKKYSLEREIKGKFTISVDFQQYDKEVMQSYYNRVLEFMAEYEPQSNDFQNNQRFSPQFQEMGNFMAQIVNDYDDNYDEND